LLAIASNTIVLGVLVVITIWISLQTVMSKHNST
jgi:hypothetical protein